MVPMNGVIGQEILLLKWRVPSRVVPEGPGVCLKILVVYSPESSGQRVRSPAGPRHSGPAQRSFPQPGRQGLR